jgi:RimJ/RimL family protein N-acetyltransferase
MLDSLAPLRTRPFALADADAVEPWLAGPGLSIPAGCLRREWPQRLLADRRIVAMVGEAGGRRIGFVRLDCGPDHVAEITLVIAPDCRRTGQGQAMFAAALRAARSVGMHAIVACIDVANSPALAFFAEQGFVLDGSVGDRLRLRRHVHNGVGQAPLDIGG